MENINTKEKILKVSINLFSKKGYNEVSMREIAKEVGIKESSIYYHYSKKEDILDTIFEYFIKRMNKAEITENHMKKLLKQSPMALYQFGSKSVKTQFESLRMIKIMRIIFIELYHNNKIREFFLKEIINEPIKFWTFLFKNFMDKKIIKLSNPRKLAESYYNYAMFKIFEAIVLNYPENPKELDLDPIFDNIEEHFNFIINSVAIKNNKRSFRK